MPPAEFLDFQIRAWRADDQLIAVLVHSSPAGDIRRPVVTPFPTDQVEALRRLTDDVWKGPPGTQQRIVKAGRLLSEGLLPLPVYALLKSSLDGLQAGQGLRLRLCLDAGLIDLPWEFLYRPDLVDDESLAGFLVLDPRVSLVREAPLQSWIFRPSGDRQRIVFIGSFWPDWTEGPDRWQIGPEHDQLTKTLKPVQDFLDITPLIDAAGTGLEAALDRPATIFHYAGHTDVAAGRGYLARAVYTDRTASLPTMYSWRPSSW
jgi:hypothetical protein